MSRVRTPQAPTEASGEPYQAEILVEVDPSNTDDDAELIPRAGIAVLDRASSPWDARALALVARLADNDARMWLALGERLAADGARPS